jgi:hypothetical protein
MKAGALGSGFVRLSIRDEPGLVIVLIGVLGVDSMGV